MIFSPLFAKCYSSLLLILEAIFFILGYARGSTNGQTRDGNSQGIQINALQEAGAEKIFSDVFTGSKNERPELDKLIKIIQFEYTIYCS